MGIRKTTNLTIGDTPVICWRNVVTATNVYAESDPDYPVSNVANPSLSLKWKHDTTDSPVSALEYLTIDVAQSKVNYVAIAGHNFGTAGVAVGLELQSWNSPPGGGESIFEPQIPVDDSPIVFLFEGENTSDGSPESEVEGINILFVPSGTAAEAAVIMAGLYTQLPEGIQANHTPLYLARNSEAVAGKSENGTFLGRIITSEWLESTATIANIDRDFVREELIAFLANASEYPFFWLWSPEDYPLETVFAWLENDPQPQFDIDKYASIELQMRGSAA